MELARYAEAKAKGGINLQRLGLNTYQAIVTKYDEVTGAEKEPEIIPINKAGLDAAIKAQEDELANIQKQLESLQMLQADVTALDTPSP